MAEASRILITGGGIAGLSLAIALRRRGYTPELAGQCPHWPAAGAGIALHANAVGALRALGLGEAVSRASAPLPRYGFYDQHGARLCSTDLDDLWGQAGPCLGIARVRLQEILAAAADRVPHRLGVAVTGLTQQRGGVSVAFADGSASDYDLVVGADGIHSTVRGAAVSQKAPSYAGAVSWRSIIPARPRGVDHLMVFTGERRYFGLVPVGGGHTYGFAGLDGAPFHDPPAGRLDRLRQHFHRFGPLVTSYLAALDLRRADPFRADRVHRPGALARRPGRAHRRRRPRQPAAHGPRRRHGHRRRHRARRTATRRGHDQGRDRPLPDQAQAASRLCAAAKHPRRPSLGGARSRPRRRATPARRPDTQGAVPAAHRRPLTLAVNLAAGRRTASGSGATPRRTRPPRRHRRLRQRAGSPGPGPRDRQPAAVHHRRVLPVRGRGRAPGSLTRHGAGRIVRKVARRSGIGKAITPRTPISGRRCGMSGPAAAWTGTLPTSSPPTSPEPPGNGHRLEQLCPAATSRCRRTEPSLPTIRSSFVGYAPRFQSNVNRRSGAAAVRLTRVTGRARSGNYAASFREMVVA